jgi:hypothetical protein
MSSVSFGELTLQKFLDIFPQIPEAAAGTWERDTLRLLQAAQFEASEVRREPFSGMDDDRGHHEPVLAITLNDHSGIAVYGRQGPLVDATKWLDAVCVTLANREDQRLETLRTIVEGRRPFTPIIVNDYGDSITMITGRDILAPNPRDEDRIGTLAHVQCGSLLDHVTATDTHNILLCKKCQLRVGIRKGLENLHTLRLEFSQHNQPF